MFFVAFSFSQKIFCHRQCALPYIHVIDKDSYLCLIPVWPAFGINHSYFPKNGVGIALNTLIYSEDKYMNETTKCEHSFANGLTYLLIGGGIGAGLALLFAPKAGSELRTNIADVTRKGYDATVEKASDLKAKSTELVEVAKEKAAAVYDFASNKLNTGVDAAEEVVSATSTAVADGLDRLRNESTSQNKPVNGRSGTAIV